MRAFTPCHALWPSLWLMASCAGDPMVPVREDFAGGRYELAREALSALAECDGENAHLYRLERGMVSFALGEPEAAIDDLRAARDRLDDLQGGDATGWFLSVLADDRQMTYQGADYEKVLVRAVLALADLMTGDARDARAYALQVAETQEQIIASFEAPDGSRPKARYKLVAFGSYLRGILDEEDLEFDLAKRSFERVREIEPDFAAIDGDIARVSEGHHSKKGHGVIHVLALVGRGPYRVEVDEPVTRDAFAIAQVVWAILRRRATIPNFARVVIPRVAVHRDNPTEVHVAVDGAHSGMTSTVTDVDRTALREFEAMKAHVIARAVVRRAIKVIATEGIKEAVRPRDRPYRAENALLDLAISGAGILWAAVERADLRAWSLLPAKLQALRLEVPEGEHELVFRAGRGGQASGEPQRIRVHVRDGYNTYVLVMAPTLGGGPPPLASEGAGGDAVSSGRAR